MGMSVLTPILLFRSIQIVVARSTAGDLYCASDNCYDLLGLERSVDLGEIKKAYRKLALKWHPDKNKAREAPEQFRKVSRANEVLSDDALRKAYDYFLDHPDDHYSNYYTYYHAVYVPQTPLWVVITGVLLFLSLLQWVNQMWRFSQVQRQIRYQVQFKRRVNEVFEEEVAKIKAKLGKLERDILRQRVEDEVFENEVRIGGSGSTKPSIRGLIGVRALFLPWNIGLYIAETCVWHWRFSVQGYAYGDIEKAYLTRTILGVSEAGWNQVCDAEREHLLSRELWQHENLQAYRREMMEQQQESMAKSGAYKRYVRWKKKH